MKRKHVTTVLALTLGIYGVHRFYLGQKLKGILHFGLAMFSGFLFFEEGAPLIMLPAIIGLMDAVLFMVMPQEEFDNRYNFSRPGKRQRRTTPQRRTQAYDARREESSSYEQSLYEERQWDEQPFKRTGVAKFNRHDYEGAIKDFLRALKDAPNDSDLHFNLACCYSIEEETMMSLYHLDKAIENGYQKFDKIHRHSFLSYIRQQPQFQEFVDNEYQLIEYYEEVEEALDEQPDGLELDGLIEQIKKLGELREKGILTDEEFEEQKRRLL